MTKPKKKEPVMIEEVDIDGLSDADYKISEWISILKELEQRYGSKSILRADAGHNNVSFRLKVKPKLKVYCLMTQNGSPSGQLETIYSSKEEATANLKPGTNSWVREIELE